MLRVVQGETVHIELICHIAGIIPKKAFGQSLMDSQPGADNSQVIRIMRLVCMSGSDARLF